MKRIYKIAPTLRLLFIFTIWAFVILLILDAFKYVFLMSCINIGSVKECVTSAVDSSGTLFAIGGILVAIVALVPTFWTDSKIRDAKKEIIREVTENVQESMQRLNQAQILMFEADRYQIAEDLPIRESLIQDAIRLWPYFKREGDKKLGIDFSNAVIAHFYQHLGMDSGVNAYLQATTFTRDLIRSYQNKAIFYLEETVKNSEKHDRDILVNLACMYGCADRYDEMIRVIEQALKADENVKDDLRESKRLSLLMRSCGIERRKIEKLGQKIGKELPMSKDEFKRIINHVDLEIRRDYYIVFFAISKQQRLSKNYVYLIKIACSIIEGQRLVSNAFYYDVFEDKIIKEILPIPPQPISIEEAFEEFDKVLYIICSPEG
jgi:tetratricopeptide (TPR) repeat protein